MRCFWLLLGLCACHRTTFELGDTPGTVDGVPLSFTQTYLKASNTDAGDTFGSPLAISRDGMTIAIGATRESSAATGINGNQADNTAQSAGAVYVFARSGSTWVQQAYLKGSNTEAGDNFGSSLALSDDGGILAVGAYGESSSAIGVGGNEADNSMVASGAVYVFTRGGSTWTEQAYLKASNTHAADLFGVSVALSSTGTTLAIGASTEASNGSSQADHSLPGAGAVYVMTRTGAVWSQEAYLKASNAGAYDGFGCATALSGDGSQLAIGALREQSSGVGIDGDQTNNSLDSAGAVYLWHRTGVAWAQDHYVKASNSGKQDMFGTSLALALDGSTLVVGAPGEASGVPGDQADNSTPTAGAVYVFGRSGAIWSQAAYLKATQPELSGNFGAVALSADGVTLLIGAFGTHLETGAAFLFERSGTTWTKAAQLTGSNSEATDLFATSVALSGDGATLVCNALDESSAATGVDGDEADNSAHASGAVYVFR